METKKELIVEKVRAYREDTNLPDNASKATINCPQHILKAFQDIIKNSNILGVKFKNPYTKKDEILPDNASKFTARHLQIIARNEMMNVTGVMNQELYNKLLTKDEIAMIRALVKYTTVSGLTTATHSGGYPSGKNRKKLYTPQKTIIIDQSGLQWQQDYRNTGGLFFYPSDMNNNSLSKTYGDWQKTTYKHIYDKDRPIKPSENVIKVDWRGVSGVVDLDQVAYAIKDEFLHAIRAAVHQGSELEKDEKINFRFLKAGMGFFAEGIMQGKDKTANQSKLEIARLNGIKQALIYICSLDKDTQKLYLDKIGRIDLPWSKVGKEEENNTLLKDIQEHIESLKLVWGGAEQISDLDPVDGYINACTNCGDPHAMPGNEGDYSSVDAAISMNASVDLLNGANNEKISIHTFECSWLVSNDKIEQKETESVKEELFINELSSLNTKEKEENLNNTEKSIDTNLIVLHLKKILTDYETGHAHIKDSSITKIINELHLKLDGTDVKNEERIKNFFEYLMKSSDDKKFLSKSGEFQKNIEILSQKKTTFQGMVIGFLLIAIILCTGILPGVLITAITYSATGKHPFNLIQESPEIAEKLQEMEKKEEYKGFIPEEICSNLINKN
jgi:hypothetical protein